MVAVTFEITGNKILEFVKRFEDDTETAFREGLQDIRRDLLIELDNQQKSRGRGKWESLSAKYAKRKSREYQQGKFPYNSLLKRTGEMVRGYVQSAEIDEGNLSVTLNYPEGKLGIIAASHQGDIGGPRNMPPRPFDIEALGRKAERTIRKILKTGFTIGD